MMIMQAVAHGNTEPSFGRKSEEGVETEARASGEIRGGNGSLAGGNASKRVRESHGFMGQEIVRPPVKAGESWLEALTSQNSDCNITREGFARKMMMIKNLNQGEIGRLRVRRKDVVAFFVVSSPNVVSSQVRQYFVYPPEFSIAASILMEDKEIAQNPGDLLEDKYQDG